MSTSKNGSDHTNEQRNGKEELILLGLNEEEVVLVNPEELGQMMRRSSLVHHAALVDIAQQLGMSRDDEVVFLGASTVIARTLVMLDRGHWPDYARAYQQVVREVHEREGSDGGAR